MTLKAQAKIELRPRRCDLREIADDTASLLMPLATNRGVTISVTGEPVEVVADPDRLLQVVTNLVSNAIVYNRPNGSVTLTTSRDEERGVLTVADTGQGSAEEDWPHLFDRFYRADKARSRKSGGNGLGLSICKSIVEAHGGTISFTSEPGIGTTFTVAL